MNIKITGKELKATDSIKNYIEKKCERLVKYFGEDFDVQATIKTEGKDQVAEMHVNTTNGVFRAVTGSKDLYASIDKNIDIVEGQIRKMKTKKDKQNMTESIRLKETNMSFEKEEEIANIMSRSCILQMENTQMPCLPCCGRYWESIRR